MHMNKLLNVIVKLFSLFGNLYSNVELLLKLHQILNILYNSNKELIENFEEELSNNELYIITNGCINASNVYRKKYLRTNYNNL